jgi:hypothetical protein
MQEPFLYKDTEPMEWSFGQIAALVQEMAKLGCLDDLVAESGQAGMVVRVPPEAVNFVKRYLFQKGLHKTSESARGFITSVSCGAPFPPAPGPVFPHGGGQPPHM